MANFNDFAFMLGMSIFDQVWLKLQQGGKPEQGEGWAPSHPSL